MAWKLWCAFAVLFFFSEIWAEKYREDFFHHGRHRRGLQDYDYYGDDFDDDDDEDGVTCPAVNFPPFLSRSCDVTDHCSKLTCKTLIHDKHWTIIFQVNRCEKPVTAQVVIKSEEIGADWSRTFEDGEEIDIPWNPGFGADQLPAAFIQMTQITKLALRVGLKKEGNKLDYKLELLGEAKVLKELTRNFDITILSGEAPLETSDCGGHKAWLKNQPVYIKALVIGGSAAVLLMLIVVTLCCCKSRRRRRESTRLSVQLPGHRPAIASTRSNEPIMMPLINED